MKITLNELKQIIRKIIINKNLKESLEFENINSDPSNLIIKYGDNKTISVRTDILHVIKTINETIKTHIHGNSNLYPGPTLIEINDLIMGCYNQVIKPGINKIKDKIEHIHDVFLQTSHQEKRYIEFIQNDNRYKNIISKNLEHLQSDIDSLKDLKNKIIVEYDFNDDYIELYKLNSLLYFNILLDNLKENIGDERYKEIKDDLTKYGNSYKELETSYKQLKDYETRRHYDVRLRNRFDFQEYQNNLQIAKRNFNNIDIKHIEKLITDNNIHLHVDDDFIITALQNYVIRIEDEIMNTIKELNVAKQPLSFTTDKIHVTTSDLYQTGDFISSGLDDLPIVKELEKDVENYKNKIETLTAALKSKHLEAFDKIATELSSLDQDFKDFFKNPSKFIIDQNIINKIWNNKSLKSKIINIFAAMNTEKKFLLFKNPQEEKKFFSSLIEALHDPYYNEVYNNTYPGGLKHDEDDKYDPNPNIIDTFTLRDPNVYWYANNKKTKRMIDFATFKWKAFIKDRIGYFKIIMAELLLEIQNIKSTPFGDLKTTNGNLQLDEDEIRIHQIRTKILNVLRSTATDNLQDLQLQEIKKLKYLIKKIITENTRSKKVKKINNNNFVGKPI